MGASISTTEQLYKALLAEGYTPTSIMDALEKGWTLEELMDAIEKGWALVHQELMELMEEAEDMLDREIKTWRYE